MSKRKSLWYPLLWSILLLQIASCKDPSPISVEFETTSQTVKEGAKGIVISGKLGGTASKTQTFKVKLSGTAEHGSGKDFLSSSAPDASGEFVVSIPPNQNSFTITTLEIFSDGKIDPDEKIIFTISSLEDRLVAGTSTSVEVMITDDPTMTFTTSAVELLEGQQRLKVDITSSEQIPAGTSFTVTYTPGPTVMLGKGKDLAISPPIGSGAITFTSTPATLTLSSFLDDIDEIESAVLTIIPPPGFNVDKRTLTIAIKDNAIGKGLVAEYLFDGDFLDTSIGANHGSGSNARFSKGKGSIDNTCVYFNGAARVQIPHSDAWNFGTAKDFTISTWASADLTQNDMSGVINDIVRPWDGGSPGYPFGISYYNTTSLEYAKRFVGVRYDGSGCGNLPQSLTPVVDADRFYHIVYVKSGGTLKVYIDGVLVSSTFDTTSCSTLNQLDLYVGCRGQSIRCFTGKVDDLRIFNRALSAQEILTLESF